MATTFWVAVCQWCGQTGTRITTNGSMPSNRPYVSGKCKSHPSGKPNMEHGPQWLQG